MKGGMNSRDVDEKDQKNCVASLYIITAQTTNCMDIYNLQHIVLHAACLLAAGILSRPCRKCIIVYFVIILCYC